MRSAFTLIELLVVITIIVVLLALLVPAMDKAIQSAELTTCAAQQRGVVTQCATYAAEHRRRFPSGKRNASGRGTEEGVEHTPWVSHEFVDYFNGNTPRQSEAGLPRMLVDPAFERFGGYNASLGWVIGYIYLANRPAIDKANDGSDGTPDWHSTKGPSDRVSDTVTCWNNWTPTGSSPIPEAPVGQWSVSAHTANGPTGTVQGGYFDAPGGGRDVALLESLGANVAQSDGSVAWRKLEETYVRIDAANPDGSTPTFIGFARW